MGTSYAADRSATPPPARSRRLALSPSRAADFKQCPLLYRFRAIDRLPEAPTRAQVRGTVVHAVLEQLFDLPAEERRPDVARLLVEPAWQRERSRHAETAELFDGAEDPELAEWLASVEGLLENYFEMENPSGLEPTAREELVEVELDTGTLLRGYIDRLDVAPSGEIRVVDYKTGAAPRAVGEGKAMFQMKFYALAILRSRGIVPRQLRLMYLADGQALVYEPDEAELRRFERTVLAIWSAIKAAAETGDFRPNPSKLCDWCDHKARCPAFGGTPPPYPGSPLAAEATTPSTAGGAR
jgi:putative RecB family exonuclease